MPEVILVKLSPMEREWATRALRAVLPTTTDAQLARQRELQRIVAKGSPGHSGPMTPAQADALACLIDEARPRGGPHWEKAMTRLAQRFRTDRVKAVKAKRSGKWVPIDGRVRARFAPHNHAASSEGEVS